MSNLSNKINSYSPEMSVELSGLYALNPTNSGSITLGTWTLTNTAPTGYSTGGPTGGAGYWSFPSTTRWRNQATTGTWANSFLDYNYTVGLWMRFPTLPTSNSATARLICGVLTQATSLGFGLSLSGTTFSTPSKLHVTDTSTPAAIGPTIETNRWYFFVAQRENQSGTNNYKYYLDGQLIATRTNTGTSGFSSLYIGGIANDATNIEISNLFSGTTANYTAQNISEIWQTGSPILNNLKYWNGTAWTVPVSKTQWDGVNWVTLNGKYWNGSAWIAIT